MKLYLARHGECEGNALRFFFGHTDYSLTPRGHEHAGQLFEKLVDIPFSTCYASCLSRSYLTAEACVKQKNISVCKLPAFNEQYMGALEGLTYEQAIKQYPDAVENMLADWTKFPPPLGESFQAVSTRVLEALQAVLSEEEDALIVSHNGPLSIMTAYLLGLPLKHCRLFYFDHGTYAMFQVEENCTRLRCFNN